MNRPEAFSELRRLARGLDSDGRRCGAGLEADLAGVRRLLERLAAHDEPELLRALLVELGAAALLEEVDDVAGRGGTPPPVGSSSAIKPAGSPPTEFLLAANRG